MCYYCNDPTCNNGKVCGSDSKPEAVVRGSPKLHPKPIECIVCGQRKASFVFIAMEHVCLECYRKPKEVTTP